ncbi:hypothetical protein QUA35_07235 [Microcoleus sp. N9_B2]
MVEKDELRAIALFDLFQKCDRPSRVKKELRAIVLEKEEERAIDLS